MSTSLPFDTARRSTTLCLLLLTLIAAGSPVLAGPNTGGTITLHWNNAITYTPEDPVWIEGGLVDCLSSVTEAPAATSLPNPPEEQRQIWFAYAAFPGQITPRLKGMTFGINYTTFISPDGIRIDWSMAPPGATEIRTTIPPWPLPGSGTSLVFAETMTELVNEVYMFAGYGSPGQIFALRTHPTHRTQFGDDSAPPQLDDVTGFGTLGFGVEGTRACPVGVGACCYPNGTCRVLNMVQCENTGGIFQGESTTCSPSPCPPAAACCFPDGVCRMLTATACQDANGTFQGEGVSCASSPCPPPFGACCFQDGSCQFLQGGVCADMGGLWHGYGSTCDPNACPQPGACCDAVGDCRYIPPAQCTTGDFRPDQTCTPNPCPQPGACCYTDGTCEFIFQDACSTGDWREGIGCAPNPCPQPQGACCFQDGSCQYIGGTACATLAGNWLGVNTSCDPNPCPQPGACCDAIGVCVVVLEEQCGTGDFHPDVTCEPNPCPPGGACCYPDGHCEFIVHRLCMYDDWRMGVSCDPQPCPQPLGACCFADGHCEFLSHGDCQTGDWRVGVPCNPNPCSQVGACCYTDGHCESVTYVACPTGQWMAGVPCVPNPCPQPLLGACCYPDGGCQYVYQSSCPTGDWRQGVPCNPNPCPAPPPQNPCRAYPPGLPPREAPEGSVVHWDLANRPQPLDKNSYVGDNMGDGREGGESWGSATVIGSLPYNDTGATCDNINDITLECAASNAPDVVYSFTPSYYGSINVSLCGSSYDTALAIYDSNHLSLCCVDDFCGLQSEIDNFQIVAGQTYYIVVDGFSTNCGSYVISLTENAPCVIDCPAGAQLEGEPACGDNYYDSYNGGCNTTGWSLLQPQSGSAVVCGKSGTYLYQGSSYRDTDWYFGFGVGATVTASCRAEFPLQLIFIYGTDCNNLQYDLASGGICQDVVLSRFVDNTSEVWIWVGPSQFNGIPCQSDYVLTVQGIVGGPPVATEKTSWGAIKARFR